MREMEAAAGAFEPELEELGEPEAEPSSKLAVADEQSRVFDPGGLKVVRVWMGVLFV